MGRRTTAALALAALFATCVRATETAPADACSYYTKSELDAWTALLEKDHLPGTTGQKDLIDFLEDQLKLMPSVKVEPPQTTKFTRWDPGTPSIVRICAV